MSQSTQREYINYYSWNMFRTWTSTTLQNVIFLFKLSGLVCRPIFHLLATKWCNTTTMFLLMTPFYVWTQFPSCSEICPPYNVLNLMAKLGSCTYSYKSSTWPIKQKYFSIPVIWKVRRGPLALFRFVTLLNSGEKWRMFIYHTKKNYLFREHSIL